MNKNKDNEKIEDNVTIVDVLSRWYIWVPIGYIVGYQLGNSITAFIGLAVGAGVGILIQKFYVKTIKK